MKYKKRQAFTMAEVLITIGIIGVVVAMTLPTVMGAYKKSVTENKLKVMYSILSNALQKINSDYDLAFIPNEIFLKPGYFSKDLSKSVFEHYIAPHLEIIQRIDIEKENFRSYNIKGEGANAYTSSYCVILINDTGLCFTQDPNKGNMYFYVITNPSKEKLIAGKDIFFFSVERNIQNGNFNMNLNMGNALSQNYTSANRDRYIQNCISPLAYPQYSLLREAFYTYLIFENNWKIPKDYPIKF